MLLPMAAPAGMLPIPDRSVDVAVIHQALVHTGADAKNPTLAQRRLLRALFRKLVPGGLLWAEMPNRFAPEHLGRSWRGDDGRHGLDGMRRLLAGNGFARFDAFVALHAKGQRHLVPLDDPTVFSFVRASGRPRSRSRVDVAREFAARSGFRLGLLPRFATSFAFRAVRGKAR
jgi:SAM-dependent methyltransferase